MMKELFEKRLSALYNTWNIHKQELWGNCDVVVIHSKNDTTSNPLSTQFFLWLFGEEFHDTTMIFGPSGIYFFTTQKSFSKIRVLCSCATSAQKIPVSVQLKHKHDDGFLLIDTTLRNARVIRNKNANFDDLDGEKSIPFVVGYVDGEYPKTRLFWSCINDLESKKYRAVVVNSGLSKLFNTADNKPSEKGVLKSAQIRTMSSYSSKLDEGESSKLLTCVKENGVASTKADEKIRLMMENLDLWASSSSGNQDKLKVSDKCGEEMFRCGGNWYDKEILGTRNKDGDQLFKFGASRTEGREDTLKGGNKNGDQLLKFGANRLDGKEDKVHSGNKNGDQDGKEDKAKVDNKFGDRLFKFGGNWFNKEEIWKERNKNGDPLFKFGASKLVGKEDKSREGSKYGDQLFKFGANRLDDKEDKSKEGKKNDDQLFKFSANKLDVKEDKATEGGDTGDLLLKFGANRSDSKEDRSKEGNKDGDQLFKFGGSRLDGKEGKSKEGNKDGNQLFKLGEGKKDGDVLFKLGGNKQDPIWHEEKQGLRNVKLLNERLTAFYASWRKYKEEQWGKADVLVISTQSVGPLETLHHSLSSIFFAWLLDREFPDTTAVFTDTGIEFLCTNKSFSSLRATGILITKTVKVPVSVQLKGGDHCLDWLKKTLYQVRTAQKSEANRCPFIVGCINGESMETGALSHSKMFEVAYVDNAVTNLLGPQLTLPKSLQMLSLRTPSGAKTADAVSFSVLAKIKSMDDKKEKSLLKKKDDALSPLLTDSSVDNKGPVHVASLPSKPEENKVSEEKKVIEQGRLTSKLEEEGLPRKFEAAEMFKKSDLPRELEEKKMFEDGSFPSKLEETKIFVEENSSTKLSEKKTLLEKKEGDTDTSIIEDRALTGEKKMMCNPEKSNLLHGKDCGEQSRLTAEGRMDYCVEKEEWVVGGMDDDTSETSQNSLPNDLKGSSWEASVVSDREDDDWTLIERESEQQVTEVAEKFSWKRWFMDKTMHPFGFKDKVSDEASPKEV